MSEALRGKVVLVTGGCRGIGAAIVRAFADAGATVVTCCRHDHVDTAEPAALRLRCDVRETDQLDTLFSAVNDQYGRLDVLINNAGGAPHVPSATASPRLLAAIIAINLTGVLYCCQRAFALMQGQPEGGSIISIGSVGALHPAPGSAAYAAAKAGVHSLTATLAAEWGPRIRVNCVAPGLVATIESQAWLGTEDAQRAVVGSLPLRRLAQPEDVAEACLFLASPAAAYVNGAVLVVDGGAGRPMGMSQG